MRTSVDGVSTTPDSGSDALKDTATLTWSLGTFEDSIEVSEVQMFMDQYPHLLIRGDHESDPEAMVCDMIDQLSTANSVSDVQFRIIETNMPLSAYKDSPHVSNYVDSVTPDAQFLDNAESLINDTIQEMERRFDLFSQVANTNLTRDLQAARKLAIQESLEQDTPLHDHPLYLPYIVVVVSDVTTLLERPSHVFSTPELTRIEHGIAHMSRIARSVGIHLVLMTNQGSGYRLTGNAHSGFQNIDLSGLGEGETAPFYRSNSVPQGKAFLPHRDRMFDRHPSYANFTGTPAFRVLTGD